MQLLTIMPQKFKVVNGAEAEHVLQTINITPRANFHFKFPELPGAHTLESLSQLCDIIDLCQRGYRNDHAHPEIGQENGQHWSAQSIK